ncbi:unnamed protein product, partial [Prorocentrum cordatum]
DGWTSVGGGKKGKKFQTYTYCSCGHWTYDRLLARRGFCVGCGTAMQPTGGGKSGAGGANGAPSGGGGGASGVDPAAVAAARKAAALLPPAAAAELLATLKIKPDPPPPMPLGEAEISSAEAKKRAATRAVQQAIDARLRLEEQIAAADKKVDEAIKKEEEAQQAVELAARNLAARVLPTPEETLPSSGSVLHIGALLEDPDSVRLDFGESIDVTGPAFSDEDRAKFSNFAEQQRIAATELLRKAFSGVAEQAKKLQSEYVSYVKQIQKKRKTEDGQGVAVQQPSAPPAAAASSPAGAAAEASQEPPGPAAPAASPTPAEAAELEAERLVYGNISCWGPQAERWLAETLADVVVLVETRVRGVKYTQMCAAARRLGWKAVGGEADATEAFSTSAGVVIFARARLGLASLCLEANGGWTSSSCSRWCVATLRLRRVTLTIVPIYMVSGEELGGRNLKLLSQVGARLGQLAGPLFIVGDWQSVSSELATTGFMAALGLVEVQSGLQVTCTGGRGAGRAIDYALVSSSFASAVQFAGVDVSAPWGTHLALSYNILANPRSLMGWCVVMPKALDIFVASNESYDLDWDAALSEARAFRQRFSARFTSNFETASLAIADHDVPQTALLLGSQLGEWALALEFVHCAKKGIPRSQWPLYVGRCQQPRLKYVPIVPRASDGPPLADRHARFWQALAVQASLLLRLADPEADPSEASTPRAGCGEQFWSTMRGLEALQLPPPFDPNDAVEGPILERWIFRLRQLRSLSLDSLQQIAEEAKEQGVQAAQRAAAAARARWRSWLSDALAGSASKAHRLLRDPPAFCRAEPVWDGEPASTPAAVLEAEGAAWHAIWCKHSRPEALEALARIRRAALSSDCFEPVTPDQ